MLYFLVIVSLIVGIICGFFMGVKLYNKYLFDNACLGEITISDDVEDAKVEIDYYKLHSANLAILSINRSR